MGFLNNKMLNKTADMLLIAGGINWGLSIDAINVNLVTMLTEALSMPVLNDILYGAIGLSGVLVLWNKYLKKAM